MTSGGEPSAGGHVRASGADASDTLPGGGSEADGSPVVVPEHPVAADGARDAELDAADRHAVIRLLQTRLNPRDLRHVLDSIQGQGRRRKSVEWIVAETERSGGRLRSRLPDEDIPAFLVDLAGPELLDDRELRHRLALSASPDERDRLHEYPSQCRGRGGSASQCKAIADRPWHSGKGWPKHFVRTLGFPPVFAGLAGSPTEPDEIDVDPFRPLPKLEDFQEELRERLCDVLVAQPGRNRGILTLPTGAGKTRTAVEALLQWRRTTAGPSAILWIAQSEELCEQAVQAFREVWIDQGHRPSASREPLGLSRLWGGGRSVPARPSVVVASIQKLHAIIRGEEETQNGNGGRRDELAAMARQVGAILIDEAHRMLAPSYTDVLGFLGIDLAKSAASATPMVGLTATPYRSVDEETRRLAARFHGVLLSPSKLGDEPIATLRAMGVLARPVHRVVTHSGHEYSLDDDPRYREHFERFGDFHPDLLQQLGQDRPRNEQLLDELRRLPMNWPTLLFACSVEHARAMTVLLRRSGRSAATVTGDTRSATRRHLIEEFRVGRIAVLSNYGVLTTGFDAPCVRALVIGRPTASPVLYEQMIGRGMRGPRFGGTDECLVIDVADNIRFGGPMAYSRYEEYWAAAVS